MQRPTTAGSKGFTLIELLIAITVGLVLLTAIYELLSTNTNLYLSKENTMVMTQDLRAAIDIMVREIRMAGCNPEGTSGIGFQDDADDRYDTDANSIRFTMDIDDDSGTGEPDADAGDTNEDINYYVATDTDGISKLYRRETSSGTQVVAEYITGLAFTYYNSAGTAFTPTSSTDFANIYAVDIAITARTPQADAITRAVKTDTLSTRVKIRNAGLE